MSWLLPFANRSNGLQVIFLQSCSANVAIVTLEDSKICYEPTLRKTVLAKPKLFLLIVR